MGWFIKTSAAAGALAGACLFLATPAAAAEGIENGGFDGGTSPWTATGGINFSLLGGALISFGTSFGSASGDLSQAFTTTSDGVFDYAFDAGRGESACSCDDVALTFEARLDGTLLSALLPQFAGSNPLSTPLLSHYAGSLALGAGDHELTFAFSRGTSGFGRAPYFLLDSVQGELTPNAGNPTGPGVPEPSTWALMIVGSGFAGAALRRRARMAVV
jgi:hypothetical protein